MALGSLTGLACLHLGGHTGLGEAACAAIGRRLRGLTALQLSDCSGLSDAAAFRLAPLAPRLRRLGLRRCPSVSDLSLAALLRAACQLEHLELVRSGCCLEPDARCLLPRLLPLLLCGSEPARVAALQHTHPACRTAPPHCHPCAAGGLPSQRDGAGAGCCGRPAPPAAPRPRRLRCHHRCRD